MYQQQNPPKSPRAVKRAKSRNQNENTEQILENLPRFFRGWLKNTPMVAVPHHRNHLLIYCLPFELHSHYPPEKAIVVLNSRYAFVLLLTV